MQELQILIVDDEDMELECIIYLIRKLKLPLCFDTAANGAEAWKLLNDKPADILFTDVKMPFMDGLELSEKALEKYPDLKVIIFSGYDDFQYAKTALSFGVSEYLLKPLNPEEFERVMLKIIRQIRKKDREEEEQEKLMTYLKQHILIQLIQGGMGLIQLKEKISGDNLGFLKDYARIILIDCKENVFDSLVTIFPEEELRSSIPGFDYVNLNPNQGLLFIRKGKNGNRYSEREIYEIAENVYDLLSQIYGSQVYLAVSGKIQEERIAEEANRLEELVEHAFFHSDKHIISMESREDRPGETTDQIRFELIADDIRYRDYASLRAHLKDIHDMILSKGSSQLYTKFLFSQIIYEMYHAMDEKNSAMMNDIIEEIYRCSFIEQLITTVEDTVNRLEEQYPPKDTGRQKLDAVKQYIRRNYCEDIGLNELAEKIEVHPGYLSRLFKQETGCSLNRYIKAYRLEKARELLQNSQMKIHEISKAAGYHNCSYFCQSYREFYGISPEQFRKSMTEEG